MLYQNETIAYIFSIVIIVKKIVSTEIFQFSQDFFSSEIMEIKDPVDLGQKKKIHSRKGCLKSGPYPTFYISIYILYVMILYWHYANLH